MHSCQLQFRHGHTVLSTLLILLGVTTAPEWPWAKPAAAQCSVITLTPLSLPNGSTGVAYSQDLNAAGGSGRYTFSIVANSLPPGLALAPASGLISGTPTRAGTYSFQVRATDSNGCAGVRAYTLAVTCPTINLPGVVLTVATVNTPTSQTFMLSGGTSPYALSLASGALPPGVAISVTGDFGRIAGTPTAIGSYNFTLKATDANECFGQRSFTYNIICSTITVDPPNLPVMRVGEPYSRTLTAGGASAPSSFSIPAGALPPGLSLAANGNLTGTPTATGSYSFTVRATDANGCAGERTYGGTVAPCEGVTISPTGTAVPAGRINTPYSAIFTAIGATAPYTFGLGTGSALPPGLTLAASGLLSGTPTVGGDFSFLVVATSANGCVGQALIFLPINCLATLNPANPTLPAATVGTAYSVTFSLTAGVAPYAFSLTGTPPPGLSLNTSTGVLSGAPAQAGTFNFIIRATDPNGCGANRLYSLTVNNPPCPTITIAPAGPLPPGVAGVAVNQSSTAAGGTSPYAFSLAAGALPAGLTLASNGNLTGTPTLPGNYGFTVRATDANGCTGERGYTLVVNSAPCPSVTINNNSPLPAGRVGTSYSLAFTGTGGTTPYVFSITAGVLPGGLTLSPGGTLSGTPMPAGNYNFNVRLTDAKGCMDEANYDLVINNPECPAVTINPATLPAGTIGAAYNQALTATGGSGSYSFSISAGTLPTGLSLASGGALGGTPTVAGNYSFTVRASLASGCAGERSYTIAVTNNLITSVSAASFNATGGLAPESIIAAFGSNLAAATQVAGTFPLPTSLAGVSLKVRDGAGTERLAPLFFVSPTQINFQIPASAAIGLAAVMTRNASGQLSQSVIEIVETAPGLFSADASGQGFPAGVLMRVRGGEASYEPLTRYDAAQKTYAAAPIQFGAEEEELFLILFGTGLRHHNGKVMARLGDAESPALYAGAQGGMAGLDQVNLILPRELAGTGEVELHLIVDGRPTNLLRVVIH